LNARVLNSECRQAAEMYAGVFGIALYAEKDTKI